MTSGRILDYINAQNTKFIPVTEAEVYQLDDSHKAKLDISGKNEIVFLNVKDIEMLVSCDETHKEEL